jgi:probable phosphoglycerate mutase
MQHRFSREVTIYLVRHGESTSNAGDVIGGERAVLTERGIAQAEALDAYLVQYPLPETKSVFVSHLPRALQTALLLTDGLRVSPDRIVVDERLCEIRRGEWDGLPQAQVYTAEQRKEFVLYDMDFRSPGGESMHDVGTRMREWVYSLGERVEREDISTIVAVTHGIAAKSLLQRIFNFTPSYVWLIGMENTSVTKIRATKHGWHLDYLNRTPHLADRGLL